MYTLFYYLPFLCNYILQSADHLLWDDGSKPKSCTTRLYSWYDLRQVVTNQTKSCVLCKLLNHYRDTVNCLHAMITFMYIKYASIKGK